MKNPWMSLWLSAANQAANTARVFWLAEAKRQQQALAKEMTRAATGRAGDTPRKRAPKRKK
jgi:hypothetical protein